MKFPVLLIMTAAIGLGTPVHAQAVPDTARIRQAQREATRLDGDGRYSEARAIWQRLIDEAPDAAGKAAGQRQMAMSSAFEGDCATTARYEQLVIDYWKTREAAEPENAFYQEGEMANEAARVCIDVGDLDRAERLYRMGYELGTREPAPQAHPKSLWDFRLAHALGRLAARRGNKLEAEAQVAAARRILDGDTAMARGQERFFPYLVGYVALHTGDLARADSALSAAIMLRGNERDPFLHCLLGMTYEKMGRGDEAKVMYQKAFDLATGHNPPAAFVRPFARRKLGL